jgi:hypothetical protein
MAIDRFVELEIRQFKLTVIVVVGTRTRNGESLASFCQPRDKHGHSGLVLAVSVSKLLYQ